MGRRAQPLLTPVQAGGWNGISEMVEELQALAWDGISITHRATPWDVTRGMGTTHTQALGWDEKDGNHMHTQIWWDGNRR